MTTWSPSQQPGCTGSASTLASPAHGMRNESSLISNYACQQLLDAASNRQRNLCPFQEQARALSELVQFASATSASSLPIPWSSQDHPATDVTKPQAGVQRSADRQHLAPSEVPKRVVEQVAEAIRTEAAEVSAERLT